MKYTWSAECNITKKTDKRSFRAAKVVYMLIMQPHCSLHRMISTSWDVAAIPNHTQTYVTADPMESSQGKRKWQLQQKAFTIQFELLLRVFVHFWHPLVKTEVYVAEKTCFTAFPQMLFNDHISDSYPTTCKTPYILYAYFQTSTHFWKTVK